MLEPRVGQAAVTLPDGRILLIGGFGPSTVLRSTEIFDPAAGAFTPGPELSGPRTDAVAILLGDGSLLVAGGYDGDVALASAELLDPAATAFKPTGSMATARTSHVGALLPDGRVLVTGGSLAGTTGEVLATTEVYDPATGSWSTTGPMSTRRHKTAAVALDDGRVLVVGGSDERDGRGRYRSAELYDPASGTFALTAGMATARYKLAAAVVRLLDGRVLIAGGASTAEIFDPATGQFEVVDGDDVEGFSFATATRADDGSVVIAGGYDDTITLTDQALRFMP